MIPWSMPPAESKLPLNALFRGWLPGKESFSKSLEAYWGQKPVLFADNAKMLLSLVFSALKQVTGRKEILIPGYTCYSVAAAAVRAGCEIVLYDLDPDSLQPDLGDVENKIGLQTIAVVGQHLFGIPGDIAALSAIAQRYGCYCVEDSAQRCVAMKDIYSQEKGADCTVYSFGRGKPLPLGRGGALKINNKEIIKELSATIRKLENCVSLGVETALAQILSTPHLYWIPEMLPIGLGKTVYKPNFEMRAMPHFFKKLGSAALGSLDIYNRTRTQISSLYNEHFFLVSKLAQQFVDNIPPCTRYPILIPNMNFVKNMRKYGTRRMYPLALCDLEDIQSFLGSSTKETPGAQNIAKHLITLPTHMRVTPEIASRIAGEVGEAFARGAD